MNFVKKILKKYNSIPLGAKAAIWFVFCSTLQKCISFITTPIFTRLMSAEQFGQYSIYNSWLQIFTIITTLRLAGAVFNKGMSKYKQDRDGYTSTMQTVTFVTTVIGFLIYLLFHRIIDDFIELPTFIMVAMFVELLFAPAIEFWTVRKRYEYIYRPVVFRTVFMAVLNAGLGIVAVLLAAEKGYARILTCILVNMCFGLILFVYNLKRGKQIFNKEYAKFAILFNLPLLMHYFAQYVLDQFDRIMVQKLVSMSAAGIYSVAYSIGLIMRILTTNINNAIVPWQYEQLEKKNFKKLDEILNATYLLVAACALLLSAFAPEIMKILAGSEYWEGVYIIPPVAMGLLFSYMYTTFANVEFYYDHNKFSMYISMTVATLNIGLNYIGISLWGYIAAAYTTLICYILFAFGHYIYMSVSVKKELGIKVLFSGVKIFGISVSAVLLCIAMAFTYDNVFVRYSSVAVIVFIMYIKRKSIMSLLKNTRTRR